MSQFRLYSFVNMYLSGIHAGIQTAHMLGEMASSHKVVDSSASEVFSTWLERDKTIIVLNGGPSSHLKALSTRMGFLGRELGLPTAIFCESQESLEGVLTSVGVVVPKQIYIGPPFTNSFEEELWELILDHKLAS